MVLPNRTLDAHDIVLLVEGSWEVWEEGTCYHLGPGDVLFLAAGRRHYGRIGCRKGTRLFWLHASAQPADAFLETSRLPENTESLIYLRPFVSTGGDPQFNALFESVVRSYWSSSATKRTLGRVMLSALLIELSARSREETNSSVTALDHLIDFIEKNPGQFFSLDELASRVGFSRRTLTTYFRKRTGDSVHGFQTRLKIRMAAATFDQIPERPVKEVAGMFGFHDEFHFSKTFKRTMGVSPLQYKIRFNRPK
jgi:AraC-like DNA-binding protein